MTNNNNNNNNKTDNNNNANANPNASRTRHRPNQTKFAGHNKAEMQGHVITDSGSVSQQFDTFYTALKVYAGSKDYLAGLAVETLVDRTKVSLMPPQPTEEDVARSKHVIRCLIGTKDYDRSGRSGRQPS